MNARTTARVALVAVAVSVALILQTTVFPHLAWHGVVPDLVLLVVVGAGLVRGSHFAMVLGFGAGVLLDLAPPADHVAGRWALALMLAGYVAGRVRPERADQPDRPGAAPSVITSLATVGACSLLASSVFAFTGLVLQDTSASVPDLLQVVLAAAVWDLALAPFVIPLVVRALSLLEHDGLLA
ncbi:hypothetical protein BH11ACT8_BH11ACT8_16560 [soil metagenome]